MNTLDPLPAIKAYPSHIHGHGFSGTSLKCSFFLITVGEFRVLFILCEFKCVLFFASNIDDMKSTINRRVGVQLRLTLVKTVCPRRYFSGLENTSNAHTFLPGRLTFSSTLLCPTSCSPLPTPPALSPGNRQHVVNGVCAQMDNFSKLCYF